MAETPTPSFDEIAETFELLDDWEDRYRYVIELGKALPPFAEADRSAANKVDGCASQVWLAPRISVDAEAQTRLHFDGDSDAHIVRGLIAILRALLSGRTAQEIRESDPRARFASLGLEDQLSSQRANGLRAMVARIKALAENA